MWYSYTINSVHCAFILLLSAVIHIPSQQHTQAQPYRPSYGTTNYRYHVDLRSESGGAGGRVGRTDVNDQWQCTSDQRSGDSEVRWSDGSEVRRLSQMPTAD